MDFEMSYALKSLKDMTVIDNGASDNVLLYTCDCTHDTALLTETRMRSRIPLTMIPPRHREHGQDLPPRTRTMILLLLLLLLWDQRGDMAALRRWANGLIIFRITILADKHKNHHRLRSATISAI